MIHWAQDQDCCCSHIPTIAGIVNADEFKEALQSSVLCAELCKVDAEQVDTSARLQIWASIKMRTNGLTGNLPL